MKDNEPSIALATYENFGRDYAEALESNAYNAHFERPSTLALLPDIKGKQVLDAGCGPGAYTKLLLERGAQVSGVDVSPAMLKIAEEKFSGKAQFYLHDLSKPMALFKNESFDFILSSLAIHYISDLHALFGEFYRLLRSGGHVVFSTHHPFLEFPASPTGDYFKQELLEETWDTIGRPVSVRFYRRPLSGTLTPALDAGFTIDKISEGLTTDSLRQRYPEVYAKLTKNPQFLFFRLKK